MQKHNLHIIKNSVIAFAMTLFFACKSNLKDVKKMSMSANEPVGVSDSINVKYTDSGRLSANLVSPKMFDYSNRMFSYSEFPDGIVLYLYDDKNAKTTVISDYAIIYNNTNLIDLQGNVIAATPTMDTLYADQLYYDQSKEWLFTNKPATYRSKGYVTSGNGFDSDKNFTKAEILGVTGQFAVQE
ncbi:LPS export ABC transporter periplasmic protein LptC [Olleya sp. YSTF-M6]|uniref:LPS export ABC transporter periplasmic protein LptC n=1 Tax=Olleya sediminilitoris TaxID=2795739 RepID=A0ABS1WIW6_9FLAO|nr:MULTISPECIES: LPS export ABC transporter periplasmic protein LptC [Olleya]MBL7559070.1 LPS export ABC transporter periplasmic protein LptC [Olleya sediminilitoris]